MNMEKEFLDILTDILITRINTTQKADKKDWAKASTESWLNKLSEEMGELHQCYNKGFDQNAKAEEIADSIMVLLIIAHKEGINIKKALINKFNKTSEKRGSKLRL